MTVMRGYTFKEAKKLVEANGFVLDRTKGDHFIYRKQGCPKILTLPRRTGEVSRPIMLRLIKEYGLKQL